MSKEMSSEKIIIGSIFTANDDMPFAEAMYISKNRVQSIGTLQDVMAQAPSGTIQETYSGLIVPGCAEGHAHVSCTIDKLYGVDFAGLHTPEEYFAAITAFIKEHPDIPVVTGQGYENGVFPTKQPDKQMLDEIAVKCNCSVPMIFQSEDCHSFWVNTKALEMAGYESNTGWIREKDMDCFEPVLPKYSVNDYKIAILHYQELATMYGITMAYEPMLSNRNEYDVAIEACHQLAIENKLHIHFRMSYPVFQEDNYQEVIEKVLRLQKETESEYFRIQGVKFFLDGVVEGHTAFLSEPYSDTPGDCSIPLWEKTPLTEAFYLAEQNNLQIHIHAIGDGALELALQALETVNSRTDITHSRHSITHLQIVQPQQIERMSKLGIIAVLNPYWHIISKEYYYNLGIPYLGQERMSHEYPVKDFIDAGIICTQGSDYPVTIPPNLWHCLALAVNRKLNDSCEPVHNPSQRIDCASALKMFTINGAKQLFLDKNFGSLENGKFADYIVLNKNPFSLSPEELFDLHVEHYVVKGNML